MPGQHAVSTIKGTGIDVLTYDALMILDAGTVAATTELNVKLQESDTDVDANYADLATGGSFAEITTANDNALYELAYSGTKKYIRAVAVIADDVADFSVTIIRGTPESHEDTLITAWIIAARKEAEKILGRVLITQTWDYSLDAWPPGLVMKFPKPPLISVTHIKYKDSAGVESATWSSANYIQDITTLPGRIGLAYGKSWPSTVLQPVLGITVQIVCGYGATAAHVPEDFQQAIKLIVGHWYEHREDADRFTSMAGHRGEITHGAKDLLGLDRLIPL